MSRVGALRAFALALVLVAGAAGCASTADHVAYLEELHTEDGGHSLRVRRRPTVLDSLTDLFESAERPDVEYEDLENPTAECHETIDDVRSGTFESESVAVRAVAILCRIADRDPSPLGRSMALSALGRLGRDAVPVVPAVNDPGSAAVPASGHVETIIQSHDIGPPWRHRSEIEGAANACLGAVRALSTIRFTAAGEARAVARLLASVAEFDPDPEIAAVASAGASRTGGLALFLAIGEAMRDENESVRAEAARVAGSLREKAFVPLLGARLADEENVEVRRTIARSLGVLSDGRAARFLVAALGSGDEALDLQVRLSLRDATGLSFAGPKEWKDWWRASGEAYERGLEPAP